MAGPGACYTDGDLETKKKDTIYHQVREFLDKGETVAVATIVSTKGSTPREVGAKMVVTAWGEILGTIGGGCGEADVKREAIEAIRTKNIVDALDKISGSILGWSGGTNIGRSLHTFNRNFAPSMVTHRSIVVIISDGWDRGDVSLLEKEMQDIKRRAKKIIWLNPLLASENYEPLCKGMQAALPYLDLFLSVHNVNSLVSLGRTLQKMVA